MNSFKPNKKTKTPNKTQKTNPHPRKGQTGIGFVLLHPPYLQNIYTFLQNTPIHSQKTSIHGHVFLSVARMTFVYHDSFDSESEMTLLENVSRKYLKS